VIDQGKSAHQQSLALKFQKGLIGTHARTLSSSQEEPHARKLGRSNHRKISISSRQLAGPAMEKHTACPAVHESNLPRIGKASDD
jgi:hypothetical protein